MIPFLGKSRSRIRHDARISLFAVLLLTSFFTAASPAHADAPTSSGEKYSTRFGYTPRTDVVYFLIENRRLAVPMNYLIKPAQQRAGKTIKTTALQIDAVWIEGSLKPYSEATRAEFEKLGVNNKVMMLVQARRTDPSIDQQYRNAQRSFKENCRKVHIPPGLTCLSNPDLHPKKDLFAYAEGGRVLYFEHCLKSGSAPHPGCRASVGYTDDVYVYYTYGLQHHDQWKKIQQAVDGLIRSFESDK